MESSSSPVICRLWQRCFGSPLFRLLFTDLDGCEDLSANWLENLDGPLIEQLIARGSIRYQASEERACLQAIEQGECILIFDSGRLTRMPLPPACRSLFQGSKQENESCVLTLECGAGMYCRSTRGGCGRCTAYAKRDESCMERACEPGLVCQPDGKCGVPAEVGEMCGGATNRVCGFPAYCDGARGDTPGICFVPRFELEEGMACGLEEGLLCKEGLSCVFESPGSAQCVRPVGSGQDCRPAVPDMCPVGEYCQTDSSFSGRCMPLPGEGQPCQRTAAGEICGRGLMCLSGTCIRLKGNGMPCTLSEECFSNNCQGGTCQPPQLPSCEGS